MGNKKTYERDRIWIADVKRVLFLKGKTYKDMAKDIGVSYGYIRLVMSGREKGENTIRKINEYIKEL